MREKARRGNRRSLLHSSFNIVGYGGDLLNKEINMKRNYIWDSIDTSKLHIDKPIENKEWKNNLKHKKKKKQRKHKRIPKQYKVYIKSKWWTRRKNQYYRQNRKICAACSSKFYVSLHHMIYGDYGNELDENLVALCKWCHEEFHSIYGVKKNMKQETQYFIINKQESISFPKF